MFSSTTAAYWADPSEFTYPFTPGERLRLAMYRDAIRAGLYSDEIDSPLRSWAAGTTIEDSNLYGMG
jgi:hypothetical protein